LLSLREERATRAKQFGKGGSELLGLEKRSLKWRIEKIKSRGTGAATTNVEKGGTARRKRAGKKKLTG